MQKERFMGRDKMDDCFVLINTVKQEDTDETKISSQKNKECQKNINLF